MSENTTPTPDARGWPDAEIAAAIEQWEDCGYEPSDINLAGNNMRELLLKLSAQHAAAVEAEREVCAGALDDARERAERLHAATPSEARQRWAWDKRAAALAEAAGKIRARGTTYALAEMIAEAEKRGAERMREPQG